MAGRRGEALRAAARHQAWIRIDPGYQSLRGDPRFGALTRRLNLPDP
jgi:hypothetical protein